MTSLADRPARRNVPDSRTPAPCIFSASLKRFWKSLRNPASARPFSLTAFVPVKRVSRAVLSEESARDVESRDRASVSV